MPGYTGGGAKSDAATPIETTAAETAAAEAATADPAADAVDQAGNDESTPSS
ncbi:hypothetical protein P3T37_007007 [Kitasatospora sp. MAA4]|uniref:hypothetical protein n=1 Tax=Kitasatospora sp. MAA4 TaxID=3035093 RepID=UPI0024749944|nr:hypothetical protein [Kitasatospora sp. MAA4]MDH6137574.1 hypothetical protein [Kitasatospora sp. MAA4]